MAVLLLIKRIREDDSVYNFFSSDMRVYILYVSQHFYFLPKQILNHFSTHFCESGVAKKNPNASKRFLYFKQLMEHFDFGTKLKYLGIKSCIYCKIQKYVCIVLLDEFIKKNFFGTYFSKMLRSLMV